MVILSLYRSENSGGFSKPDRDRIQSTADEMLSLLAKHSELATGLGDCRRHPPIPQMKKFLMNASDLSEREAETCAMVVIGRSAKEIACDTGLSVASVATYRKRAYQKLGVTGRLGLTRRYDTLAASPA